jgi:hypothetical protein
MSSSPLIGLVNGPHARVVAAKRQSRPSNEHDAIMPGLRRPRLAIHAERRSREQQVRIGTEIQVMRERRGWTRIELASRAGLGRMVESRIERGVGTTDILAKLGVGRRAEIAVWAASRPVLHSPRSRR